MSEVNIFIACMLPERQRQQMEQVATRVRAVFRPEGKDEPFFHSTLLFIGKVDGGQLPFIQEKMAEIAATQSPIDIDIDSLGYFYNAKRQCVKVLYAVPSRIPTALTALCQRLYTTIGKPLASITTPPIGRPAQVHFTIAKRLRHRLGKQDFATLARQIEPFSIHATMGGMGLYHCKDLEHRYYREISHYTFKGEEAQ